MLCQFHFAGPESIWNHSHSDSHKAKHGHISPIAKSLILTMTLKKRSKKPLDPSGFLWALKRKMSSIQPTPFEFNTQQDVNIMQMSHKTANC